MIIFRCADPFFISPTCAAYSLGNSRLCLHTRQPSLFHPDRTSHHKCLVPIVKTPPESRQLQKHKVDRLYSRLNKD